MIKLGSLFDGSGGFPLAGSLYGIVPVWASEIEPYPMRVTALRFPQMKQLGDVTKINGAEIEPVDIITFGSPCQDLSVAGLQKGFHDGERSNLFFEAIRIIKEMRDATANVYPRFGVWENVPGAFSSNKGEDFRAVIEAFASVCEDGVAVPKPPKGKWSHAGGVVGDNWSLAWRVYDAQYWGVPQRRKRIYLVADFGSRRAPEILFERESLRGDSAESGTAGEGTADDAEGSAGGSGGVRCLNPWDVQSYRQYDADGSFATLQARENSGLNHQGVCYKNCLNPWDSQSKHIMTPDSVSEALCSGEKRWGALPPNVCYGIDHVVTTGGNCTAEGPCYYKDICPTEKAAGAHAVCYCIKGNFIDRDTRQNSTGWRQDDTYTLDATDRHAVCIDCRNMKGNEEISGTLQAKPNGGQSLNYQNPVCVQNTGRGWWNESDTGATLRTPSGGGGDGAVNANLVVYDARGNGDGDTVPNLTGDHENRVTDYTALCVGNGQLHQTDMADRTGALNCMHDQQAVVYPGVGITSKENANNPKPGDPAPTLSTDSRNYLVNDAKPPRRYIVRRLTPLECCRLQGFPDWWEDGADGSDSARCKMWGNGIALPCAADVLGRIAKEMRKDDQI